MEAEVESLCCSENQRYLYPYEQRGAGDIFQDGESELETPAKTSHFSKLLFMLFLWPKR